MAINKKIAAIALIVLLALAGLILHKKGVTITGALSQNSNPSTDFTYVRASDTVETDGYLVVGGAYGANSVTQKVSTGTCSAASTTLFAVLNPFTATSTVVVQQIVGTGQATTSSLLVGTSTKSVGLAASDVSPTLVNSSNGLATSTKFYFASGVSVGTGFTALGSGTSQEVGVGPSEYVVGFSTTTASGSGGANYTGGQNCTYKLLWYY